MHIPPTRKLFVKGAIGSGALIAGLTAVFPPAGALAIPWAIVTVKGVRDMTQKESALKRTRPAWVGEGRYKAEMFGPEFRQWWIQSDTEEVPYSREQRNIVYARAKGQNDKQSWGTLHDLNRVGAEWLAHSGHPLEMSEVPEPRITIGGPQCKQPYNASVFNTSGMSYGSLSAQAVMALSKGAHGDNFFMNTGEGGISPYHLGFDINTEDKNFDFEKILNMAYEPMTDAEAAKLRAGKRGTIEKGLVRLLPLSPEEQLEAIDAGKEEALRARIAKKAELVPNFRLQALGIPRENVAQDIYEAYMMTQAGVPIKPMRREYAELILPIVHELLVMRDDSLWKRIKEKVGQLPVDALKAAGLDNKKASHAVYQHVQSMDLEAINRMEPTQLDLLGPIIFELLQETAQGTPDEQAKISEEILLRGLGKMLGAKTPEELEKLENGLRGKALKGLAKRLRMNTMQYTRFPGGDLVWNIGTGYFGCRDENGNFDPAAFRKKARLPQVKMIELKLSQGAKPGGGGILPAEKLTHGLAKMRGVTPGRDCISPARHSAFDTPAGMLQFLQQLRDLSGGKPVGFKLCIGKPHEFFAICKAMKETGIFPDFITIDGAEGGTGAASAPMTNNSGLPLRDALEVAHNGLIGVGLRDKVKILAAGKAVDEFDIISLIARGADGVNAARAMMLSIGCIMARICHTNKCPVGVATQDPELTIGLDPDDKGMRNASYHRETIEGLRQMMGSEGAASTSQITAHSVYQRDADGSAKRLSEVGRGTEFVKPGDFLKGKVPDFWKADWEAADPASFEPNPDSELARKIEASIKLRQGGPEPT